MTGDGRYLSESELQRIPLSRRLARSIGMPLRFILTELIIDLFALYLVVIYIILFGFLPGFDFIFGTDGIYGLDQNHTGLCFISISVGFLVALVPIRPIFLRFKRKLVQAQQEGREKVMPEERLVFAIIGAPFLPISIFWIGWTAWPSVSL